MCSMLTKCQHKVRMQQNKWYDFLRSHTKCVTPKHTKRNIKNIIKSYLATYLSGFPTTI